MSTAKHTPGPWAMDDRQAGDCYAYVLPESGGILSKICRVDISGDSYGQSIADARLIAAAPDLLEALQALFANMLAQDLANEAKRPTEGEFIACMVAANAAIAKATGGQA